MVAFLPLLARIYLWNILPNGRHAHFSGLWGGKLLRPRAFHREMRTALTEVFTLLAQECIEAQIGRCMPLEQAANGMRLVESGTIADQVVLAPGLA